MSRSEPWSRRVRRLSIVALGLIATGCATATTRDAQVPAQAPAKKAAPAPVDDKFHPETGPFVGASVVTASIGGDFDGNTVFVSSNGNEVDVVPDVSSGGGGRLAGGWRWTHAAVELAYQRTTHDGKFGGVSGFDVTCNSFEVDGRYYLPSFWERLKPSVLAGIVVPWLDVKNGSSGQNRAGQTKVGTATYYGVGANLGLGADFYVTRHWSIDLLAAYRWLDFTSLSGVNNDGSLDDNDVNGSGYVLGIGTSWTF
jgi:hypothetical protein